MGYASGAGAVSRRITTLKGRHWKIVGTILALVLLALLVLIRPWAEYNPLKLNALFAPDKRIQNFRSMEQVLPYRVVRAATPFEFSRTERPLEIRYTFNGETRRQGLIWSPVFRLTITVRTAISTNGGYGRAINANTSLRAYGGNIFTSRSRIA